MCPLVFDINFGTQASRQVCNSCYENLLLKIPLKSRVPTNSTNIHVRVFVSLHAADKGSPQSLNRKQNSRIVHRMANNQIKVLLIEDNPVHAKMMEQLLGESSVPRFEVDTAGKLSDGLDRIGTNGNVDVVLLDLIL